jgi:hypothetical protein
MFLLNEEKREDILKWNFVQIAVLALNQKRLAVLHLSYVAQDAISLNNRSMEKLRHELAQSYNPNPNSSPL